MKHQKLALTLLTLCWGLTSQFPAWGGTVLDRIKQTGIINAGTRKDSIPFAYVNDQGQWVGYSLDILELIRQRVEKQLQKPIKLNLVEVNPSNRFEKIKDQSIDIECGSTTMTWEREKTVDFSFGYFPGGTQMLVKKGSNLDTFESLANKPIGVIPQTTNEALLKTLQPQAKLVPVKDRLEGLAKLEKGEIDGFASDGILLVGLRQKAKNPSNYQIVPEYPYLVESYACVLPHDESQWRDLVNFALVSFMEGIVSDAQTSVKIYERWFGDKGVTPYPRETISKYFEGIINSVEWIPLTEQY